MTAMITRNPLGFHSVEALRKDRISNAEYYRDNILTAFILLVPALTRDNLLFPQTMQGRTLRKNLEPFVQTMGC
jgi:hypothetical protein